MYEVEAAAAAALAAALLSLALYGGVRVLKVVTDPDWPLSTQSEREAMLLAENVRGRDNASEAVRGR